jgi:hypothetical protein
MRIRCIPVTAMGLLAAMAWHSDGRAAAFDTCAAAIRAADAPRNPRLPEVLDHFRQMIVAVDNRNAGLRLLPLLSDTYMRELTHMILGSCRNAPNQATDEAVDGVYDLVTGLYVAFRGRR